MGQERSNGVVGIEFAVTGLTIEAVEFEVFVELRKADEAFEGGSAHLGYVFELHVIGNEGFDLVGVVIGETEAAAEAIGHADADFDVAIEADAVSRFGGGAEGWRLANVVEQDAPGKSGRNFGGKPFKHEESVDPDVALRMELRGLGNSLQGGDFGENFGEQVKFVEEFKGAASGTFGKKFGEFFADAFGRDNINFVCVFADGGEGSGFDGVAEARGETHRTEHAELIFGETAGRLADGADDSGREIGATTDKIEDLAGIVAHEETVDGEVAALHVFFWRFGIDDLVGMAAVGVANVGAEGGYFDFEGILADEDDAELSADIEAAGEEPEHFLRRRIRCHVVVRGFTIQKDIAHATADEESLSAVALKRSANRIGEFAGIHGMIMRLWGEVNEVKEVKEVKEGSVKTEDSETFGVRIRSSGGRGR